MLPVYSLPPNLEKLSKTTLERQREKTQEKIDDLKLDILALDGIILNCIEQQDRLKLKIPLVSQPAYKEELIAKCERLAEEQKITTKRYQDLKHELATLHYNLEQLDIALNTIQEAVNQLDD